MVLPLDAAAAAAIVGFHLLLLLLLFVYLKSTLSFVCTKHLFAFSVR